MNIRELLGNSRPSFIPSAGLVNAQLEPETGATTASLLTSLAKAVDYAINDGALGQVLPSELVLAVAIIFASARRLAADAAQNEQFPAELRKRAADTLGDIDRIVRLVDAPPPASWQASSQQQEVEAVLNEAGLSSEA